VLPEYRSRGIGGLLIEAVLQAAKAQGCAAVDLEVDHEHHRAEQLYQRFGFDPLSRSRWVREL
jgi:ribosomal protein S18 acetylase RimI-like enzyme